mmetsp:Transcript_18514/g.30189  ORF Transcript_18514/g.30189 Transcript_18514/m.30189 type:complete len:212 (-) Transcript_18514:463-1098(-)
MTIANRASGLPCRNSTFQKSFARATEWELGATTTSLPSSSSSISEKYRAPTLIAVMLSEGTFGVRKPCICPECISTHTTVSAPTVSNICMQERAAIGFRSPPFLESERAYAQYGITTVIFFAEERLMVETMSKSSTKLSFTFGGHVDCTITTCFPRTFSLTLMDISPSAKVDTSILPSSTPRNFETSCASGGFPVPAKTRTDSGSFSFVPV